MISILELFCTTREKPLFAKPFTIGDFTYATDGIFVLRVKRLPGVYICKRHSFIAEKFLPFPFGESIAHKASPMPDFTVPEMGECRECQGKGELSFRTDMHDYHVKCKGCGGEGVLFGDSLVSINSVRLLSKHLQRLKLLDSPIFFVTQDQESPIYFRFSTGDGLIMPYLPGE